MMPWDLFTLKQLLFAIACMFAVGLYLQIRIIRISRAIAACLSIIAEKAKPPQ